MINRNKNNCAITTQPQTSRRDCFTSSSPPMSSQLTLSNLTFEGKKQNSLTTTYTCIQSHTHTHTYIFKLLTCMPRCEEGPTRKCAAVKSSAVISVFEKNEKYLAVHLCLKLSVSIVRSLFVCVCVCLSLSLLSFFLSLSLSFS